MAERPWLILTLRRTGGTSLTGFLAKISGFRTIQHEPFNTDRRLAHVTALARPGIDRDRLVQAMRAALQDRPNIKHCFEFLPPALTEVLIAEAARRDYHVVLLTRRDEGKRQLSLCLAMATGAWGPDQAAQIYPQIMAGNVKPQPIDLAALKSRIHQDYAALGRVLAQLRAGQIGHDWLLFEELYAHPEKLPEKLIEIAASLGVKIPPDDPRLPGLAQTGGQNSGQIAPHVGNFDAAQALVARSCLR